MKTIKKLNKEKNITLAKILNYCKERRDILDKQGDACFLTDVDVGRVYELTRIIEIIESEGKTND